MPYLTPQNKKKFVTPLDALPELRSPGELNYLFTKICLKYLKDNGLSYQHLNDVDGALGYCGREIYRRIGGPYELGKIKVNGDVGFEDFGLN